MQNEELHAMKQDLIRYCLLINSDGIITLETQSPKSFF